MAPRIRRPETPHLSFLYVGGAGGHAAVTRYNDP